MLLDTLHEDCTAATEDPPDESCAPATNQITEDKSCGPATNQITEDKSCDPATNQITERDDDVTRNGSVVTETFRGMLRNKVMESLCVVRIFFMMYLKVKLSSI